MADFQVLYPGVVWKGAPAEPGAIFPVVPGTLEDEAELDIWGSLLGSMAGVSGGVPANAALLAKGVVPVWAALNLDPELLAQAESQRQEKHREYIRSIVGGMVPAPVPTAAAPAQARPVQPVAQQAAVQPVTQPAPAQARPAAPAPTAANVPPTRELPATTTRVPSR